jgi:heavy metal sensor kinase
MMFFKSLRFRLTIWYLLVIAVILASLGTITYFMLSYELHHDLNESLRSQALEIESGLRSENESITFIGQTNDLVFVYDSSGSLIYKLGPDVKFTRIQGFIELALLGKSSFMTESDRGQPVSLYATPYTIAPNTRVAIVVGRAPTDINQTLGIFRSVFLLASFIILTLTAIGSSRLTNIIIHPIKRMMGIAEDIGEKSLDRRIEVKREDELGRLASTLNGMMERLEVAFNRQRQFAADASHELRTPLSVIQAEATLALGKERTAVDYKKSLEIISQEVDFMSTVIGNLLLIARNEGGKELLKLEKVDVRQILNDLSLKIDSLARQKGLQFSWHLDDDLPVRGDVTKLTRLFTNILDNAVRYTPQGGSILVTAVASYYSAIISIADNGVGIAPEHLHLIFERFYRVDKARSRAQGGAGLGLSIAKQIAELHGGIIEVESQLGQGSTFRVILPLNGQNPDGFNQRISNVPIASEK